MNPSLHPIVDYEQIWEQIWGDMQKYGPVHRHHRRIFHQMLTHAPVGEIHTIADVGCGEGSNLGFLRQRYPSATLYGFDISATALDKAHQNVAAEYQVLDIEKQPLPGVYDLVVCSDVIEHIADDDRALNHIRRAAGRYALIASVQGKMRAYERTIGHVRSYAYGELPAKMTAAGFHITQTISWGFPFYSPLYRDLFNRVPLAERASHGAYGWFKKLTCHALYALFLLNRGDRGDIIFAFGKVMPQ